MEVYFADQVVHAAHAAVMMASWIGQRVDKRHTSRESIA